MLKTIPAFIAGFVVAFALLASLTVLGQADLIGRIRPAVIDIQQSVPVLVEIDGATVPITVDVALQVSLSGPITASVQSAAPPELAVSEPTPRPAVGGTDIASAQPLDYEEIARYTEDHVGEVYSFRAEVYGISDNGRKLYVHIEGATHAYGGAFVWWDGSPRMLMDDIVDIVARIDGPEDRGGYDVPAFTALSISLVQ